MQSMSTTSIDPLLFDEPGDGALWARTPSYKARFDGAGATSSRSSGPTRPATIRSSCAPARRRAEPVARRPQRRARTRQGDTVRIDQGAFVAEYELAPRLARAALRVRRAARQRRPRAASRRRERARGTDTGSTLRFENELGRVDYGQAFALDATASA
jgi:hypothetical protein